MRVSGWTWTASETKSKCKKQLPKWTLPLLTKFQIRCNYWEVQLQYNWYVYIQKATPMMAMHICLLLKYVAPEWGDKYMHIVCIQLTSFCVMNLVEFPLAYAVWTTPTHIQTYIHTYMHTPHTFFVSGKFFALIMSTSNCDITRNLLFIMEKDVFRN